MITIARRRRGKEADGKGSRPAFERALFSIMGPAQIGENKPPEGYLPDESANFCPKCGQPWDDHDRASSANMTYAVCPTGRE